jgi:F-type H+-transporting ATPase subunit b
MLDQARAAIRAEQDKALAAIRAEVVELSVHAASKVLDRNVSTEDDRRFVEGLIAPATTGPTGKGGSQA